MKNKSNNNNDRQVTDDFDSINEHINILVSFVDQLNDKNNCFNDTDDKLNDHIEMLQNIMECYYNFCTEKI